MRKTFLEKNPFYILEVMPNEKRGAIISKAEEKAFFADDNECEDAQAKLLNPEKRLSAELDWFFEVPVEKIADIYNAIGASKEISIDGLTGISRINAIIFNFEISNYDDIFELGYAILELDENFSNIDLFELLETINSSRGQAGLRAAVETELESEINRKRGHLRQLISEKVSCLSEDDYIEFTTMLADKCVADEDYADGVVISDVIDQYEIKMQSRIEEAAEAISAHIERIKKISNAEGIETSLSGLVRRVKDWDRLVQPLQLKAMASGIPHGDSAEMGRNIHDFSVWLHNEKELSQLSLSFIGSIKPMFAEIREIYDVFESDCKTLSNIIKSNKDAEQIVLDVDSLKASANSLKIYPTSAKVDELIFKIKAVNKKAKQIALERDLVEQVRENICYIARDVAITLHNEKEQTELALKIANTLLSEFNDLPSLKTKLSQDVATLNQQILAKARIRQQEEAREQAAKAKGIGCLVWVGIILLLCLISGGLSECDSASSNQTSTNSPNYSYSSDAETYTVSLNKQNGTGGTSSVTVKNGSAMPSATAPTRSGYTFKGYYSGTNGSGTKYYNANMTSARSWDKSSGGTLYAYWEKKADSKFTSSSSVGDNVYVDIKSIFPEIGIYTEGSSYYSEFVCRCVTSSGSTVWINMTCSEYKSYFDSDASTSIFNSYADEITFSSPKRIHGVVKKCDSVLSGLSADTGTTLLISFKSVS